MNLYLCVAIILNCFLIFLIIFLRFREHSKEKNAKAAESHYRSVMRHNCGDVN